MDEKEQLLSDLYNSTEAMNTIHQLEARIEELKQKPPFKQRKTSCLSLFLAPIVAFAVLMAYIMLFSLWASFKEHGQALTAGLLIVTFIAVHVLWIGATIHRNSKAKAVMAETEAKLAEAWNNPSLAWLPPMYRNSLAYEKIKEYTVNKRANSLKEALNLFETEMHQARLELMQNKKF